MEPGNILSARDGAFRRIVTLTAADIRNRFARAALGTEGILRQRGDHELNPGTVPAAELRAAAVLIPLVDRDDGLTVLLTQRTAHLSSHAGQISFPGGSVEESDADATEAALRETMEEIGLDRFHIEPVGRLGPYVTRTGFMVTPVVAIINPPFDLKPDAHEVADVFEVPLDFILDSANRQTQPVEYQGLTRYFYVYPYGERYIWGATAGMLNNLAEFLAD